MVKDERVEEYDEAGDLAAERRRVGEHQTVVDVINTSSLSSGTTTGQSSDVDEDVDAKFERESI